jgi:hypothetical protein
MPRSNPQQENAPPSDIRKAAFFAIKDTALSAAYMRRASAAESDCFSGKTVKNCVFKMCGA